MLHPTFIPQLSVPRLALIGAAGLLLSMQPAHAGPCSRDIDSMQVRIEAHMGQAAAAGPSAKQTMGAQMHRQPTPNSVANAERKLGDLSPATIVKVNDAMNRAQRADAVGDEKGCRQALEEVARIIGK